MYRPWYRKYKATWANRSEIVDSGEFALLDSLSEASAKVVIAEHIKATRGYEPVGLEIIKAELTSRF